jgi:Poly (ADP-ribose) glycohydrolase (PARG)
MMPLLRRSYVAAELIAAHPPKLRDANKQVAFALACPSGARHTGTIDVTRWAALALPEAATLAATEVVASPGYFDYAGGSDGVWHVNFADPRLFVAYGSHLLAQDEIQVLEHPLLGSVREALVGEGDEPMTHDRDVPTPILVANVERRCAIATDENARAGRPFKLYGNRFGIAPAQVIRDAVTVLTPPTRSHLIAIAAPNGGRGPYTRKQVERVLVTALTGFAAAAAESHRLWPSAAVEIRTGFWGCGAFGGNRIVMTALQILAARLAGIARLTFYVFDDAGRGDFERAVAELDRVIAPTVAETIAGLVARGHAWGVSDGT